MKRKAARSAPRSPSGEGALITCLDDHATHYSVPALDGGAVSELTIETMSGEVTIGASSSGSN